MTGDVLKSVPVEQIAYEMIQNPRMCKACVEGRHEECDYKHCECRKKWHWALVPILHS